MAVTDSSFKYKSGTLQVTNGHSKKYEPPKRANVFTFAGKEYKLVQFHFHSESEHTINHHHLPLECHFVHQAQDGGYLVISIMFKSVDTNNTALAGLQGAAGSTIADIDPKTIIGSSMDYYYYDGSFTTPPCTEGVKWVVMKEYSSVGKDQIAMFEPEVCSLCIPVPSCMRGDHWDVWGASMRVCFYPPPGDCVLYFARKYCSVETDQIRSDQ